MIEVGFRPAEIYLEVIDGYILFHSPARKILLRVAQMLNWRILVEGLVRRGRLETKWKLKVLLAEKYLEKVSAL